MLADALANKIDPDIRERLLATAVASPLCEVYFWIRVSQLSNSPGSLPTKRPAAPPGAAPPRVLLPLLPLAVHTERPRASVDWSPFPTSARPAVGVNNSHMPPRPHPQ